MVPTGRCASQHRRGASLTQMLITVFARREPTHCHAAKALEKVVPGCTRRMTDIAIYRDAACTKTFGRFGPDSSSRPRKNTKVIQMNCWPWSLEWLPNLEKA